MLKRINETTKRINGTTLTTALLFECFSRKNNKIKYLYEQCLRLIYSDKKLSYENILQKENSVSIHHKDIQEARIHCEIFLSDYFMKCIFHDSFNV